jgi:hypothetical protein
MESRTTTPTPFSQSLQIPAAPPREDRSCRQQIILAWAILATVALVLTWVCGIGSVIALMSFAKDPPLGVQADYPLTAREGETFELVVHLRNHSTGSLSISDIDLDEKDGNSILHGATVERTQPALPREEERPGQLSFGFNQVLGPGEERQVVFTLKAIAAGEYAGDLEIYTDNGMMIIPLAVGIAPR